MRFVNMTNHKVIDEAIVKATNLLFPGSSMLEEISLKNDWKYDSGNGWSIATNLSKVDEPIKVFTYRPKLPWSRAIGAYSNGELHLNVLKLPSLSPQTIIGNLLHEWAHHRGYRHGNNYKTKDKCLYSVPYYLSENVKKWIKL
jgi:ribosome modulation factor